MKTSPVSQSGAVSFRSVEHLRPYITGLMSMLFYSFSSPDDRTFTSVLPITADFIEGCAMWTLNVFPYGNSGVGQGVATLVTCLRFFYINPSHCKVMCPVLVFT